MLVLTETAAKVAKSVMSNSQASGQSGLRISSMVPEPRNASALEVTAATQPDPNDQVLEAAGARIFVAPQAAAFLDDKILDADVDGSGNARFSLGVQRSNSNNL